MSVFESEYPLSERSRDVVGGLYQPFLLSQMQQIPAIHVDDAEITVGAETVANNIEVDIQLNDLAGEAVDSEYFLRAYFSTDADGDTIDVTALPTVTIVATTGVGVVLETSATTPVHKFKTDETGLLNLNLEFDNASETSFYLNIILPSGAVVHSDIITFAAE